MKWSILLLLLVASVCIEQTRAGILGFGDDKSDENEKKDEEKKDNEEDIYGGGFGAQLVHTAIDAGADRLTATVKESTDIPLADTAIELMATKLKDRLHEKVSEVSEEREEREDKEESETVNRRRKRSIPDQDGSEVKPVKKAGTARRLMDRFKGIFKSKENVVGGVPQNQQATARETSKQPNEALDGKEIEEKSDGAKVAEKDDVKDAEKAVEENDERADEKAAEKADEEDDDEKTDDEEDDDEKTDDEKADDGKADDENEKGTDEEDESGMGEDSHEHEAGAKSEGSRRKRGDDETEEADG